MKSTIAVTKQWQIHIPKSVRQALGLKQPTMVDIETRQGKMIITPSTSSVLSDAGKYANYAKGKKVSLNKIRDQIDYGDV